jgi:hypothetical protein
MDRDQKSWILRVAASAAVLTLLGSTFAARGMAEERARREEDRQGREVRWWRHGDIRRFHEEDLRRWRGGHWLHGRHFGRLGWWWVVSGAWYFYPVPVYPYPDPYLPPTVAAPSPPTQSPPQYWYYCASMKAYYPYVTNCPEGWMQVVPQPTLPRQ